jgi:hypothetical protein
MQSAFLKGTTEFYVEIKAYVPPPLKTKTVLNE